MVSLEAKTTQQWISSDNVLTQYLALRLPPHSTCWALCSQNSWTAVPTESPKRSLTNFRDPEEKQVTTDYFVPIFLRAFILKERSAMPLQ